jgi:demethylmenaquinone methyltransferase/2-methoxy-6-polyprenyl-1,4-benzoquinol methylase
MFDGIARRYDLLNRIMSFGLDRGWRRAAVRALALDRARAAHVLDLATGTGDLAIAIARRHPRARVLATDPSTNMLAIAARKVGRRGLADRVVLADGSAEDIAVPDASFDAVTIAFGIRNVVDRDRALREMTRVCRAGGRVVVLELGEPRRGLLGAAARFHVRSIVPRIGALLSGAREYRYLQTSIAAFPPPETFRERMRAAGLDVVAAKPLALGATWLFVGTPTRATESRPPAGSPQVPARLVRSRGDARRAR